MYRFNDYQEIPLVDLSGEQPLGLLRAPDPRIAPEFMSRVTRLHMEPMHREMRRLMQDGPTEAEAHEARLDYLRFLSLIHLNPGLPVVPSRVADSLWHISILFTKDYAPFCKQHFGHFVHHRPGDEELADAAFERSAWLMKQMYGVEWGQRGECASCDHQPMPMEPMPMPSPEPMPMEPMEPMAMDPMSLGFLHNGKVDAGSTAAVRVAPSALHGRGVIAAQKFDPGDVVDVCSTVSVDDEDLAGESRQYAFAGSRLGQLLLPAGPWMFVNHSDQPNLEHAEGEGILVFTAVRPITPGDELTLKYVR